MKEHQGTQPSNETKEIAFSGLAPTMKYKRIEYKIFEEKESNQQRTHFGS